MIVSVPKEIHKGENRVAATPSTVAKMVSDGFTVRVEPDAGLNSAYTNEDYIKSGAEIIKGTGSIYTDADIILKVNRPAINEINEFKKNSLLISFIFPLNHPEIAESLAQLHINTIAMDFIPRTTKAQKMDALSSQANLAGYKAVLLAANKLSRIFPLLMTAAGTVKPAKVLIMGAGVAGLQALGTAKRLGAIVEVSDIRPSVKEEVQSLGGKFLEVDSQENLQDERGYAKEVSEEFLQKQKDLIFKHVTEADIIITTALVPGKKAPVLVTEDMVKKMKQGSVIVDMAVDQGGNCELSENDKTVTKYGVHIIGESNLPGLVPVNASDLYSFNVYSMLQYITKEKQIYLDPEDEIVKSSLITYNGNIINEQVLKAVYK